MFLACILLNYATISAPTTPPPAKPITAKAATVKATVRVTVKATVKATVKVPAKAAVRVITKPVAKPVAKPTPSPAPKPVSGTFRTYLTQAGCGSVNLVSGPGRYAQADWYNNRVILGVDTQGNTQWIATHECAHFKQLWQYGSVNAVWSHFGDSIARIECDADRRAAAQLGWSRGIYC